MFAKNRQLVAVGGSFFIYNQEKTESNMAVNYTVTSEECKGNLEYMLKKMRQKDKETNTTYTYLKKQEYIKPSKQRRNERHKSKQRMLDRNANNPFATDRRTERHN